MACASTVEESKLPLEMKLCSAGIITLLANAGRESRSRNWVMFLASAMTFADFFCSGVKSAVLACLLVATLLGSTFA